MFLFFFLVNSSLTTMMVHLMTNQTYLSLHKNLEVVFEGPIDCFSCTSNLYNLHSVFGYEYKSTLTLFQIYIPLDGFVVLFSCEFISYNSNIVF
jgi:hypothetical protein